jgi:hypothetical protein
MVFSKGQRIIRTRNGYIGLAPCCTRPGDWIGVFKGGKVPLVIRPDGPHWLLIGECYIHGIVKGEVWNEGKCETVWLKWLVPIEQIWTFCKTSCWAVDTSPHSLPIPLEWCSRYLDLTCPDASRRPSREKTVRWGVRWLDVSISLRKVKEMG